MPRVRELTPDKSPAHFFGAEVRHARERADLSQVKLGDLAHCDGSVVSKIESGEYEIPDGFPQACDGAFPEMGGFFTRFWETHQAWDGPYPPWFADWVEIERKASMLRTWEPLLVPGLLQTPEYARAVFSSWRRANGDYVEEKVAARLVRQAIFDKKDGQPPDFRALVDESVLTRRIGTSGIMTRQLEYLAVIGSRPNITIQVVPESAGAYVGLSGAFVVATTPSESEAAHLETGVRGMTIRNPKLVNEAAILFDDLRDEAYSRARSQELITEAVARWTG